MRRVGEALVALSKRVGFRIIPGLGERVIYRELFPSDLTMLDIGQIPDIGLGHVAARQELRELVAGLALEEESPRPQPLTGTRSERSHFQILDRVNRERLRRVGRNWVTQCPSCAAVGRDHGKDNLAISVEEPSKYLCWAGCTNIQIRAALGAPAPANAR